MTDDELKQLVVNNDKAIDALGQMLDQGFSQTFAAIRHQRSLIQGLREVQQENAAFIAQATEMLQVNDQQITLLVEESRENNRQDAAFRERSDAITETL